MMTAIIVLLSIAFLVCGVLAIRFFKENKNLNSKLAQEEARNEDLSVEVKSLEQAKAALDRDLAQEKQRNETLSRNLVEVSQSNESALWLLYVSEQALQYCGVELYRERNRSANLEKVYREFCEEVRSKAKRRAWKKGGAAIFSLIIPAFGVIGVFDDISEAFSATAEVVGDITRDILDMGVELPSEELQQVQRAVTETVEQKLGSEFEISTLSDLNDFVVLLLERVNNVVEPIMEDERVQAIKNIADLLSTANKLRNLGIQAYDFHRTLNMQQGKNSAKSANAE